MSKNIVVHTFYENGVAVWRAEWYQKYTEAELKKKAADSGFDVDYVSDTTGRLVNLKEGQ